MDDETRAPPPPPRDGGAQRSRRAVKAVAVAALLGATLVVAPVLATVHRKLVHVASGSGSTPPASASAASGTLRSGPANAAAASPSAPGLASADLSQWCARIASDVPGVARPACQGAGLVAGDGRSVRGVPLWTRDVRPVNGAPRFKVLLLGGIHGDELASVTLAFDWIARSHAAQALDAPLAAARAGKTGAPRPPTMADVAWRFVPLLNPDGLMHAPSTRVNAHGVDLNRNFPTADWARDAQPYWVQRTKKDPRRFPGPQPLSEPESRWLQQQIEQFRPDLIVSVHAPYGLLDFDGPPPAPRRLGSLQLDPVGVYPGSLGNYGGLVKQVPVMTLELKNARKVPPGELAAMWGDLQRWIDGRMARAGAQASAQATLPEAPGAARASRRQD